MAGYEELVELLPESWADPTSVKFTVVKIVEFVRIHRAAYSNIPIFLPHTVGFNATESAFWSLQESNLTPSCIVRPKSSQEVADTLSILVSQPCAGVEFAVKSGGHAPAAGFANINHGVTIDMTGISTITTSKSDYTVASVGAGSSWVDVYAALEPFNRTVAGGRNGAVGVGGLTLGGGISYFSPQVGFTCDTVVGFEVVLADGRVVQASANSPFDDLFKALKGGMNNFGIVTQIDFFTVPLPKEGILGGSVVYDIKYAADVFRAFATISGAPQYDIHASIVIGAIFNSTARSWTLSSTPIYTLPEIQPAAYEELFAIPNITSSVTLVKLSTFSNESVTPPLNWLFYTATFGVSAELLDDIFSIANESLYNFDVPGGVLWDLAFEPFPTAFLSHSNGQDVLGTSPAHSNGIILLVSALWPELADDDAVRTKAVEMMTKVRARAVRMGMLKRFVYGNYADWSQLPIESYGKENVEFLRKVSAKYDPDGVFQKKVTGGFKLPATRRIK